MVVDHRNEERAAIPNKKKKVYSFRDIARLYRSLFTLRLWRRRHKISSSDQAQFQPQTIDKPFQGPGDKDQDQGNMNRVRSSGNNGDGLGTDGRSSKGSFKHRSMDTFFSSVPSSISRTACKRSASNSPSPRASFVYRNGSLRSPIDRNGCPETLSRGSGRWNGGNPIMFSNSTGMVKPPPIERQLECTLEELCFGCTKKIKITRDVLTESGQIVQQEEILPIKVKPGWKKGTKITFEGLGNERPGSYAADVTFVIAEKRHNMFRRDGDNLELVLEIPLVKALIGCTPPIPLLGGEEMKLQIDEIIHPGYEKIIIGQGMPNTKEEGSRGNLRVLFLIKFPTELTDEQRAAAVSILADSCS